MRDRATRRTGVITSVSGLHLDMVTVQLDTEHAVWIELEDLERIVDDWCTSWAL